MSAVHYHWQQWKGVLSLEVTFCHFFCLFYVSCDVSMTFVYILPNIYGIDVC
jgi:hypothetical protein